MCICGPTTGGALSEATFVPSCRAVNLLHRNRDHY